MKDIKNKSIIVLISFLLVASCGQNPKASIETQKLPSNFLNSARNISANSKGIVHLETSYRVKNNNVRNADIYLIHKNGGNWWIKQANKKFPDNYYAEGFYATSLVEKDSSWSDSYNKWAFFIDKEYLEPKLESAEGGEFTSYYPKKNSEITVVLFEQKSGDKEWMAIDSITYKTDNHGNELETNDKKGSYYLFSEWENNFIEEKVKESNR
jgi:hypothetical protein